MPGQKNRNAWTQIEIFEQKRIHLDKGRSISIEEKYMDRNENNWTKTEMPGQKQKCLDKNRNTWTKKQKYLDGNRTT